ncbi:MAG: aminomethyl-transferring glycine dehydrogenase, partial [Candidatus Faecousia sp.]|nr:aminomethyl-transferring glycine dehydrogenase [Candidatus Faecousia sp.]
MGSYVPATAAERREMLQAIGMSSEKELYSDVPASMLLDRPLNLPAGKSELEVRREMEALAAKNKVYATVLRGAGA